MLHLQTNWSSSQFFKNYTLHFGTTQQIVQPEIKEWIVEGLIRSMPVLKIAQYFEAKQSWFEECEYLIVAVEKISNDLIAVLASSWVETNLFPFVHIKIQMIADRYQKTFLLKHMWRFHLNHLYYGRLGFPSIIALKTCHPAVFSAMRLFSRIEGVQMYPQIGGEMQESEMSKIACMIVDHISPGLDFCMHTGVIKNASVPLDFYPSLPTTKKADVGHYFQHHLTAADRLLCILSISTDSAKHRILQAFGEKEA